MNLEKEKGCNLQKIERGLKILLSVYFVLHVLQAVLFSGLLIVILVQQQ